MGDFWLDKSYYLCYRIYSKKDNGGFKQLTFGEKVIKECYIDDRCYKKYAQRRWAEYNLKKKKNYIDYEKGDIVVWYIADENEPPFENVWDYSERGLLEFIFKYNCDEINKPKKH